MQFFTALIIMHNCTRLWLWPWNSDCTVYTIQCTMVVHDPV